MWAYLKRFPEATAWEISALRNWVKEGNSPYENGDYVCDEKGYPLDFINTMRFWDGLRQEWFEDPEAFMAEQCPEHNSSEELDPEGWMNHSSDE